MKKKILKIIFILIIIALLCGFGFLFYLKSSINTNLIKDNINNSILPVLQEYNKHYHFKDKEIRFNVRGSITISFPFKLIINDIDIKNIQYKDVLLSGNIKKVEIKLSPKDLLNKKISPKNVNIIGADFYVEKNKLDDFYYNVEKIKKVVKLEDNEVFGVKDKLKSLLTSTTDNKVSEIEEGYKEIEVEEKVRYELDNTKVRMMLIDIFTTLQKNNINLNYPLNFNNVFITLMNNKNIEKEFKNVNGTFNPNKNEAKINFTLNNINAVLNILTKKNNDNEYSYTLKLINNTNDEINISLVNKNLLLNNFNDINSNINIDFKTENLNNLIQWLFSTNSKIYDMFNYKKNLSFKTNIVKTGQYYNINNMVVDAEDIKLKSSINFTETNNKIDLDIEKINLDNFIINIYKKSFAENDKNINIFKYNTFEDLLSSIAKTENNNKTTSFSLNIKELIYKNNILSNSKIEIEKNNEKYKINSLDVKLKDLEITASDIKEKNGYYYNDLLVKGNNFDILSKIINVDNIIKLNNFILESKIFINNDVIYFYDYSLKNDKNEIITTGNAEYSFKNNNNYIAIKSNFENLDILKEEKKVSTLKEKFLWLNNISNNVFVDLNIKNLNYNNKKMTINSKIHYYPGFINFYNISNITTDKIKNLKGSILLGLGKKEPIINANLSLEEIKYEGDLINYVFNIEKYKNTLLETEINEENQKKYWITKLFSIPTLEEVNGNINININNIYINNSIIDSFKLSTSLNNGLFNIIDFRFNGFGGSTELKGNIDLKKSRNFNLILTDTMYNIQDIFKLFSKKENDSLKGTIGIGGLFKANGFNESVFLSSMNFNFKFISNNLYIKKLGLEEIKNKLNLIYNDNVVLNNFDANKTILNDSGTTFNNVEGSIILSAGVNNLILNASTNSITNKLVFKIDNSGKTLIIDAINTSIITTKVGDTILPLYTVISFKEDFSNKAKLTVNTSQIDEYIKKVKETKAKNQ